MKLLFSIYGYEKGGVATSFCSLAKELEKRGHEIRVILPGSRRDLNIGIAIPEKYVLGWTPSLKTPIPHLGRVWLLFNCLFRWKLYLSRIKLNFDYDCFVMFHGKDMIWRWYKNVPSVMWFQELASDSHCLGAKGGGFFSLDRLCRWSRKRAALGFSKYVAITRMSGESLQRYYSLPECPQIINPLFDVDSIEQKAKEVQHEIVPLPVPQIGYVGRLSREKGVDRLIAAVIALQREGFTFHTWIVGDGPERKDLERIVFESRIVNVHFLGAKENQYPYMSAWDLTILPSREEGMGMVLWESIICGTPVMATATGGPIGALEDGKLGALVENSEEGITDGLRNFLTGDLHCEPEGGLSSGSAEIRRLDSENRRRLADLFSSLSRKA